MSSYKVFYSFEAWIRTIFKNLLKDYFKKSKEINFSQLSKDEEFSFEDTLCSDEDILNFLDSKSKFENIQSMISKLDETSREILFLKYVEESSNKEISKILGINEEVVRQRLSRAIKKLKTWLNK
ncbi:MAG: sigma-70 family RNA polymerase sigma factor [Patescibacteria group bacterium]